jgi:hypothetical protein
VSPCRPASASTYSATGGQADARNRQAAVHVCQHAACAVTHSFIRRPHLLNSWCVYLTCSYGMYVCRQCRRGQPACLHCLSRLSDALLDRTTCNGAWVGSGTYRPPYIGPLLLPAASMATQRSLPVAWPVPQLATLLYFCFTAAHSCDCTTCVSPR